jgi:hypothetical protein
MTRILARPPLAIDGDISPRCTKIIGRPNKESKRKTKPK